ncbi:MAG: tRNA pseudouridine(13) synthase TruD, partial [archaeon]|nr:tRNA pseudouridine(13) synthase TruD [archaeon]
MELKESPEYEKRIGIWFYATQPDGIGGTIKTKPTDFVVREVTKPLQGLRGRGAEPHNRVEHKPLLSLSGSRERGQSPR